MAAAERSTKSAPFSEGDLLELVLSDRQAQGFPRFVEDPVVIAKAAALLSIPPPRRAAS